MTTYVHLPQVPLTLKFEEPHADVLAHFQGLVSSGEVHRYHVGDGQSVIVNYAVVAAVTVSETHRALDVSELHRGLKATISSDSDGPDERVET